MNYEHEALASTRRPVPTDDPLARHRAELTTTRRRRRRHLLADRVRRVADRIDT